MQLIILTCSRIYSKEGVLIHNNGDKLYRGELTRAADEKRMINELGHKFDFYLNVSRLVSSASERQHPRSIRLPQHVCTVTR